jgi:hypothetical protein
VSIPVCWTSRHDVTNDGHIDLSVAPAHPPAAPAQPVAPKLEPAVLALADEYARRFEQFKDHRETPTAIRWMLEPRRAMEHLLRGESAAPVEMDAWHPQDPDNPWLQESPAEPMFAARVAGRKWEELQAEGHQMQRIEFAGPKGSGAIDRWGKVLWEVRPPVEPQKPVAWVRVHPDGSLAYDILFDAQIEETRRKSGAWRPLYAAPVLKESLITAAQPSEAQERAAQPDPVRAALEAVVSFMGAPAGFRCPYCSRNPTTRSDFCDAHRPGRREEVLAAARAALAEYRKG